MKRDVSAPHVRLNGWGRLFFLAMLIPGLLQAQGGPNVRSGVLTVVWGDPAPGSVERAHLVGLLTGRDGKTTPIALTPELLKEAGGLQQIDHRWVEVTLRETGPDASGIRQVDALSLGDGFGEAAVTGSQPWISVMCKFSDVAAEPKNLSYFVGMYANAMGRLDHYWRQLSYDQINVVGSTAAGWVTLPHTRSYYLPNGSLDWSTAFNECTAAADSLIDFSNGGTGGYVGINLMFNDNLDCCAWGGAMYATLDGITKVWRTTWEPPWGYSNEGVIAHEMGHGFGLPHSNNSDDDGWPYDSPWDVMSDSWGYALSDPMYGILGKHTISYHKDSLGWISSGKRFEVLKNGSYSLTIDELAAAAAANYRMAKIRVPGASRSYTVESRKHDGYDGALAGEAVIIHEVVLDRGEPAWLVDADAPPAGYSDNEGVMWRPGETFVDPSGQFEMTVNGASGAGFNVTLVSNRSGAIYQEDFESGLGGFWTSGLWHQTAACAAAQAGHSPSTAFYFGLDAQCDYDDGAYPSGSLGSPAINLNGLAPPLTLTFNYFLETEPGGFDLAQLYIYEDQGGSFEVVAANAPGPWVTLMDPSDGWRTASIDLQPYAGSTVWLYFYFAGDSTANGFAGFYVDDVKVWSCYSNEVVNLVNQTVSSQQVFRACDTVTGQNFQIAASGNVTFRAGKSVILKDGFRVSSGGTFAAVVGPPEQ
ncbi:MAG TPA: hypothetical protein VGC93_18095 [Thermoanaerobaculia bacterium]